MFTFVGVFTKLWIILVFEEILFRYLAFFSNSPGRNEKWN
jgi:hypothetical protein